MPGLQTLELEGATSMLSMLYVIPILLGLAIITWVYFDAVELGKPAIPWAIAQPLLWWLLFLPLILYVIFREQGTRRVVPPGGAQRQAAYILSFVGYAAAAYGISAVIALAFISLSTDVDSDTVREIVSSSVAAIVVGGGLWVAFWLPTEPRLHSMADDAEFRATFYLHRAYLYTLFGLSWLIIALLGMWLIAGFVGTLSGTGDVNEEAWSWTLGPIIVAAIAIIGHYTLYVRTPGYRQMLRRFQAIPSPPLLGPTAPAPAQAPAEAPAARGPTAARAAYCGHCGSPVENPDQEFCVVCGRRLVAASGAPAVSAGPSHPASPPPPDR